MARNLTEGNIKSSFIKMAFPLVVAQILNQTFNLIDIMVAGKILGETAIASIGATSSFIELFSALFWGLATGMSLYVANVFGSGSHKKAYNLILNNLIVIAGIVLVLSIICTVCYPVIFRFLKVDASIWDETFKYYIVYMLGIFLILTQSACGYACHAIGDGITPLIVSLITAVLNIGGNVFFILCTPLGVMGVALSSVICGLVGSITMMLMIRRSFRKLGVKDEKFHFAIKDIKNGMQYGIPALIQQSALYISSVAVQPTVNIIGPFATAGYTIAMKLYSLNAAIFQASSKCVSNYTAQCLGAKKYEKIKSGLVPGFIQALLFMLPMSLACIIFPEAICSLFFNDKGAQSMAYALKFIPYCMPFMILPLFNNLFHSYYRGVKAMKSLIFATSMYTVVRAVVSYALINIGIEGIYIALDIAWLVETITSLTIFLTGIWRPKDYIEWQNLQKIKR